MFCPSEREKLALNRLTLVTFSDWDFSGIWDRFKALDIFYLTLAEEDIQVDVVVTTQVLFEYNGGCDPALLSDTSSAEYVTLRFAFLQTVSHENI